MTEWSNWGRNQFANPRRVATPSDPTEVAAVVKAAARDGLTIKAVGSGHSFTGIALTDGVQVRLDRMDRVLSVDTATGLATVEAGIPLHRLNAELEAHGLSMTNLGDIDRQTVSGATSTGTHGTGARLGGIATQIRGLELVTADGSVLQLSAEENAELYDVCRLGLGAFGVVTAVTLQTEPLFRLTAQESPMPLDEVLERFDELADGNDHFEFYWFPHTDVTLTKRNNRAAPGEGAPLSRARGLWDDEVIANGAFAAVQRLGRAMPRLVPSLNRTAGRLLSDRTFTDVSHRVFVSPRRVRFREMEYAVPRGSLVDVVREARDWIRRSGETISFPIEVRVAAADDIPLSTAYGRDSGYLAVHQYWRTPFERWFRAVEGITGEVGGRPHWGKLHWLDAATLAERYPRFGDALAVRDRLDPGRLFANDYVRRVLGD